ncbi:nitrate reductase associated protein [[Limnothrix rosea] IAM M-220]|uniref:nitrate reductase associated protein n=1 Tax=[Limnothrix rosea] IAM M-220 TaxID=454133 RepID=UPI00095CDED7|nr:nitrate reductase associated protein [[Limnothrix rosea] IAM M-220]OKH10963.1 nitrate reductase associated protein [[Limnothrix rosea] IAM M-220]
MTQFFQFEQDFIQSMRCIPMVMRYKLDMSGVKMKLSHWGKFDEADKQKFVEMPCDTTEEAKAYHDELQAVIEAKTGAKAKVLDIPENPLWQQSEIPAQVLEKAEACDVTISSEQWQSLTNLQRFALIKLSRPSHENHNFVPAMKEFGLIG